MISLEKKMEMEAKKNEKRRSKSKESPITSPVYVTKSDHEIMLTQVSKNIEKQMLFLKQELINCMDNTNKIKNKNKK